MATDVEKPIRQWPIHRLCTQQGVQEPQKSLKYDIYPCQNKNSSLVAAYHCGEGTASVLRVPEADVSTFINDFSYNSSTHINIASYQILAGIKNVLKYFV
jgi:hypothetical protein